MSSADHRIFTPAKASILTERGLFNREGQFDAANEAMCKLIGRKLAEVYPGHPWGVVSEIEHGVVKIALQGFTQWPVTIRVSTLKGDPSLRAVVKYAGELLERLQLPRKGFSLADWKNATTLRPWHFHRNARAPE